jgi:hypothetical protein
VQDTERHTGQHHALAFNPRLCSSNAFFVVDVLHRGGGLRLNLRFHAADGLVEVFLLLHPCGFAAENGAIQIGIAAQATCALHQLGQCLARADLVDAGHFDFATQAHKLGALFQRHGDVVHAKDGDHVTGHELDVVGGVFVFDGLAQVEGDQGGFDGFGVQAFDGCVVPVDFGQLVFDVAHHALIAR